ncbi:MAG: peptidoglycan bridge formation glycyltransferase FemA/FemB family protein [Sphaerochaeta sp.]|jgi:lipid II:glycine glycyltransferase (peptidoglycan interpeptide bridge formation enzyme)|nr:peptidoglycan bridge formation glycyltransferase FemA/FemB family protein [Sphaerochaeta sp.]
MVVRPIDYKKFVCTGPAMQSSFWAALKHGSLWKPYAFEVEWEEHTHSVLVLVKQVLLVWNLAYIPFGPDLQALGVNQTNEFIRQLAKQIKPFLPPFVFALRFDLPFDEVNDENVSHLYGPRLRTLSESVQPEATVRINLKWGYQAVKLGYRDRAKRALRKASQSVGVGIWGGDESSFRRWYDIYLETARRDGFSPRSARYLKALLTLDGKVQGDVSSKLFLAILNRKIVGGIIVVFSPSEATYLYGASLRLDGVTSSHPLQDYAIKMACDRGCSFYDLYGIAGPKGRGSHLAGLEVFKLSFGGQCCYRTPSTDYVYRFIPWKVYTISEWIRYRLKRRIKPQEGVQPNS